MVDTGTTAIVGRLRTGLGTVVAILRTTYESWYRNRTIRLGAGLAYYALFAIVPILTLVVWIASLVVSAADLQAALEAAFDDVLGSASVATSDSIASELDQTSTRSGLGLVGAATTVIAATLLFVALQDALSSIWSVPVERGVRSTLRRRILSLGVVVLLGAWLVGAIILGAATDLITGLLPDQVSVLERVSPLIETSTSWAAGVVAVAMILRLLAPVPLRWVDVLVGGAITAALIVVGTELLGLYLDRVATASLSGAAGALALFLIWLYYEAQIILVGAELTKVLSDRRAARSGGAGTG
ncbi:MAG: YihY/virulence factor BrkB family protein [Actinomycetota bacterium]